MELGQVVFSKCGRDKGTAYVVVGLFEESGKEYASLADGRRRTADKPKRKKLMHIQQTNLVATEYLIRANDSAVDALLRKAVAKYAADLDRSENG